MNIMYNGYFTTLNGIYRSTNIRTLVRIDKINNINWIMFYDVGY